MMNKRLVDGAVALAIMFAWGLLNEYIHVLFNAVLNGVGVYLFGTPVAPSTLFNVIVALMAITMIAAAVYVLFRMGGA